MGFPKYQDLMFVYEYDFATDGGAVSSIDLRRVEGVNELEDDLVIEDMQVKVETALTSSGSATVTLGNSADADGYMVDFFASASLGASLRAGEFAGALLWDDTNDHQISYTIPSAAASIPKIEIGTAALTAGKIKVIFKCRRY